MSDFEQAPAPMALDDAKLADSGQSASPQPVDLGTLDATTGAPSPVALGLIGTVEEAPASPDPTLGLGAPAGLEEAPAPSPAQGTPPGEATASVVAPAPMDLQQLHELESR